MKITLGSNIASLQAQRQLAQSSQALSSVFERLASGQRINRASDDAAGLAVLTSLEADRRVYLQGVRNLNEGISLLNIADETVQALTDITIRLKELAEQAANGTFGATQREALDAEAQALSSEYFRIARSTEYNGRHLFDGDFGTLALQAGFGAAGAIQSGLGGAIGTGTVGGSVTAALAVPPNDVATADLNGDGILDLVTTGGQLISVQLGLGQGAFGAATTYSTLESAVSIAVALGDLNGDGMLDVVTSGFDGGTGPSVTIRLGNGDGTFKAAASADNPTGGPNLNGLALADFNSDGILDIATNDSAGRAWVQLGTGNGTVGAAVTYTMNSTSSSSITAGDLNNDGIMDLITAGTGGGTGTIAVRFGTGGGGFGSVTEYSTDASSTFTVAVADLNGDGLMDIVTSGVSAGAGTSVVRLGTGNGVLGLNTYYAMNGSSSSEVRVADLNGDGILDLLSAGTGGGAGTLAVRLGAGNGTFGAVTSYSTHTTSSTDIVIGDYNGDGVPDAAIAGSNAGTGVLNLLYSNTTSGISPLLPFQLTSRPDALQALAEFSRNLDRLSAQRGVIGAFQARVSIAQEVLTATATNYAEAAGRIRDADIAAEAANMVRLQILQQAGAAVLAQANQQPALAIKLLQGLE